MNKLKNNRISVVVSFVGLVVLSNAEARQFSEKRPIEVCFSLMNTYIKRPEKMYQEYIKFFNIVCNYYNKFHVGENGDDQLLFLIWRALVKMNDNDLRILLTIMNKKEAQTKLSDNDIQNVVTCLEDAGGQRCVMSRMKTTALFGSGVVGGYAFNKMTRARQGQQALNSQFELSTETEGLYREAHRDQWRADLDFAQRSVASKDAATYISSWRQASKGLEESLGYDRQHPLSRFYHPISAQRLQHLREPKLKEYEKEAEFAKMVLLASATVAAGLSLEAYYRAYQSQTAQAEWQEWKKSYRKEVIYKEKLAQQFNEFLVPYSVLLSINKIIEDKIPLVGSGSYAEKSAMCDMLRMVIEHLNTVEGRTKCVCVLNMLANMKEKSKETLMVSAFINECHIQETVWNTVERWWWKIRRFQRNVTTDLFKEPFYQMQLVNALRSGKIRASKSFVNGAPLVFKVGTASSNGRK